MGVERMRRPSFTSVRLRAGLSIVTGTLTKFCSVARYPQFALPNDEYQSSLRDVDHAMPQRPPP